MSKFLGCIFAGAAGFILGGLIALCIGAVLSYLLSWILPEGGSEQGMIAILITFGLGTCGSFYGAGKAISLVQN
jgi:hypothetical protein